jgi:hypothetical protein
MAMLLPRDEIVCPLHKAMKSRFLRRGVSADPGVLVNDSDLSCARVPEPTRAFSCWQEPDLERLLGSSAPCLPLRQWILDAKQRAASLGSGGSDVHHIR